MYIVEGDQRRRQRQAGPRPAFQAILPLRGKILNVERARFDKMLAQRADRHADHRARLRRGGGGNFEIDKLRYHRIIIMTDADVDGTHIRTLLLTFFFRQMNELIRARLPLHRAAAALQSHEGKKERFLKDEQALDDYLLEAGTEEPLCARARARAALSGAPLRRSARSRARAGARLRTRLESAPIAASCCKSLARRSRPARSKDCSSASQAEAAMAEVSRRSRRAIRPALGAELQRRRRARRLGDRRQRRVSTACAAARSSMRLRLRQPRDFAELREIARAERTTLGEPLLARARRERQRRARSTELADVDALWTFIEALGAQGPADPALQGPGRDERRSSSGRRRWIPDTRVLLQVTDRRAGEAEEHVQQLMGDEVEPRREFIEGTR